MSVSAPITFPTLQLRDGVPVPVPQVPRSVKHCDGAGKVPPAVYPTRPMVDATDAGLVVEAPAPGRIIRMACR